MATSSLHARRRTFKQQTQPQVKRTAPQNTRLRDVSIDVLRLLACFAVVLQHSTAGALVGYGQVPMPDWHVANILNALTRFAVPVFLMMSGALLINRPGMDALRFYKRRTLVLLRPYLLGSVIYFAYILYVKQYPLSVDDVIDRL